ncbi:DUF1707 SHOCT-like domain-containing protein [Actinopolymorpha pittospori]|uniref:DUF1707 domain-containing protein n=1 Tax=Actinopolymorpha pittospori TaxID=648752 RepID=A0A927R6H6_9ACTN|nr:DUF1707 domain-containing protein [Actinopolymorpha pittospori]MBE1604442.1 hypothetical protein [Actinopolymorpha pittospori]
MTDPTARAAHADRDAVIELLRVAAGEGRIDLAELDERLERAHAAKTYGELDGLVADLAGAGRTAEEQHMVLRSPSGIRQAGRWTVPRRITAHAHSGGIRLDFSEAVCLHREVALEARADYGAIVLTVPRGWSVVVEEASTIRFKNQADAPADPGAPTLRIVAESPYSPIKIRHPR